MVKWKKIISDRAGALNNIFKFNLNYTKTKEDGSTKTYTFAVDIPDLFVHMKYGNRLISELMEEMYLEDESAFITTALPAMVDLVATDLQYKIGALIEANDLYFNPLWNVDGTEKITEDRAKRQTDFTKGEQEDTLVEGERENTNKYGNDTAYTETIEYGQDTNTMKYGNNASYTESMQYGLDETTHTNGIKNETTTRSTSPFNESADFYPTEQNNFVTTQYDDKDSRAIHTDTATHNPHTDVTERSQHTDTTTHNPHTDVLSSAEATDTNTYGERKDVTEQYAYKDTITTERHGNIGVTKSTELLESYRDLPSEMWTPVLNLFMQTLSRGY